MRLVAGEEHLDLEIKSVGDEFCIPISETSYYETHISNRRQTSVDCILSLDIYPVKSPRPGKRHLGCWHATFRVPHGGLDVRISLVYPEVSFDVDGQVKKPDGQKLGRIRENGLYDLYFTLGKIAGSSYCELKKVKRQRIFIFDGEPVTDALKKYWPGLKRRAPFISDPAYVTLRSISREVQKVLQNLALSNSKILDFGCGEKPYYPFFLDIPGSYVGVDLVLHQYTDVVARGEALPFSDDSFGLILSLQVMEHVADVKSVMSELRRVCKKGGIVIISVPFVWEIHNYPEDFWRFAKSGLEYLAKKFKILEIKCDTNSAQSLLELFNLLVDRKVPNKFFKKIFFSISNVALMRAAMRIKDTLLPANYILVLRK